MEAAILATLPVERRLALAYAPLRAKRLWFALFALDTRLASTVHKAVEPMLTQIKLAWWRDELAKPLIKRRRGEPLLELLEVWGDEATGLAALVDGWELVLGESKLDQAAAGQFADERAKACMSLADKLGASSDGVAAAARGWALADLGSAVAEPISCDWPRLRLAREMRPLAVLYGLARRSRGRGALMSGPIAGLRAVRLGMLGI